MKAGNKNYQTATDIPDSAPVFPLPGALLLPGGQLPLNIFEPRYVEMIDDALAGDRLIVMAQPSDFGNEDIVSESANLCQVGCLSRIISLQETGDGRYAVVLSGICRVKVKDESVSKQAYRRFQIEPFVNELENPEDGSQIDRETLEKVFRQYLDAHSMEADWESIKNTDNESLLTALCMMSPYGPAEKQALLEAPDLKTRTETLIALTEIHLARKSDDSDATLQ